MSLQNRLARALEERETQNLRRVLRGVPAGALDVASNDYLGLSRHHEVIAAAQNASTQQGGGARASRLVGGDNAAHRSLEAALAKFKKREAALVFSSGFAANLGVISSLAMRGDVLFCDKRNHASLVDACKLAAANGALVRYYAHPEKLRALLSTQESNGLRFIVSDSVYSMDGDVADVSQLLQLCEEHDATLILDDAHGTGVLGAGGRGAAEHFQIDETLSTRLIEIGTLSKALGAQGGFVVGSQLLIDFLINAARPFIYSTGLAPAACAAAQAALEIIEREPQRVARLHEVAQRWRDELRELGFSVPDGESAIIPILAGDEERALKWSAQLLEKGVWCPAIRPPTVPRGTSRLRLTASATMSESEMQRALQAFAQLL